MLALTALLALLANSCYSASMATITIRNLDETVKRKLQVRAALNGRSMEAEAREWLCEFAQQPADSAIAGANLDEDFGTAIRKLFAPLGGVELQIPPRQKSHRPIPTFE
jgi:plasmid stability protein